MPRQRVHKRLFDSKYFSAKYPNEIFSQKMLGLTPMIKEQQETYKQKRKKEKNTLMRIFQKICFHTMNSCRFAKFLEKKNVKKKNFEAFG